MGKGAVMLFSVGFNSTIGLLKFLKSFLIFFISSNDVYMIYIILFVVLVSDLRPSALAGSFDVSRSMFDLRSPPHRFMKVSSPCNLDYTENSAYLVDLFLLHCVFKVNIEGHCTVHWKD